MRRKLLMSIGEDEKNWIPIVNTPVSTRSVDPANQANGLCAPQENSFRW